MVSRVRNGETMRLVARENRVALSTVQWWVERARGQRLDRADWSDRPPIPRRTRRTDRATEELVLRLRKELKDNSVLGEYGAPAIHRELVDRGFTCPPSIRTIGRILERRGALDGRRRVRRSPPPPGWYLPDVAQKRTELDSFDFIESLKIQDGPIVDVLNATSLHGGLVASWPTATPTAKFTVERLLEHWLQFGLPTYAQFDNDTRFQGGHQHRDVIGRVSRTCLLLGVIPVFAPPQETGFQAAIESFNSRWQAKVWARFHHDSLTTLQHRSWHYVRAVHRRAAHRIEAAPARRAFPKGWRLDLQAPPRGQLIYLRRSNENSKVYFLGRTFDLKTLWPYRLVRCEVHLTEETIRFYGLRRRAPDSQPLLHQISYVYPRKRFLE